MLSCNGANGKQAQSSQERDLVMIVMEKKGDGLEAVVWSEPPIYMDTWALNLFSRDQAPRDRFLKLFQDRGTLLISVMLPHASPTVFRSRTITRGTFSTQSRLSAAPT